MATSLDRLKELNLSRDEVNRLGEALKKQEFRQLLADYVEEIQDPENRKKYENEVKQIERERGQEVTFLHPTAAYVIKTSVDGNQKAFVNVCANDNIGKPSFSASVKDGTKGLQWTLPHSLSPPQEDVDNKNVRCQVFDVLFHPDTIHLASRNQEFRSMMNNIALSAIETNFDVTLDKKNLKFPKMSYKGMKRASIIRTPSFVPPSEKTPEEQEMFDKIYSEIDSQRAKRSHSRYTTPQYVIKHRSHVDIQECTNHKNAKLNSTIPKELIVEINLPLLKSSNDMELDVTEKTIQLVSEKPAKYKLNLTLPYQVIEANGSAKFEKDLRKLVITLPVKPKNEFHKEDSGVESCVEGELSPTNGSDDDENRVITKCDTSEGFLDSSEFYNLPDFTCNVFDNVVAFTLHVKNVDKTSVHKQFENSIVKVKFTSISSSFYPSSYAFFVKFPKHQVYESEIIVEVWDNNVIFQIPLKASDNKLTSYWYGTNEELQEKSIEEPAILNKVLDEPQTSPPAEPVKPQSKAIDIQAISYESSGDELSACSYSPRKGKGILKRISARGSFGRSVSESSLDDYAGSSLKSYNGSIECVPEDSREDYGMSSSLKKTVRFNDVVSEQLFRLNSSILGQKKKNQRKARNKKRAHERRFSESESSDVENKRERENLTIELTDGANTEAKKEDGDIFHLEMNN